MLPIDHLAKADRLQEARALEADERRARQEWIESQKKAREEEKKEERKMRAETLSHVNTPFLLLHLSIKPNR